MKRFYQPELDVLRFAGFLCIFIHHSLWRVPKVAGQMPPVVAIANAFSFGLCLFFVLSAYLITTLLLREKDETGAISLRYFYLRRMLRIWPLYFLALIGGMLWSAHLGELRVDLRWYLAAFFMAGNAIPWAGTIVQHLWSISIEEQLYLLLPAVIRNVSRRGLRCFALFLIVVANLTLARFGIIHADTDLRIWSNSLVQFEMFAAGILLALLLSDGEDVLKSGMHRLMAAGVVPVAWFAAAYFFRIKGVWQDALGPWQLCAGYGLVALSCCLLILSVLGLRGWPSWMIFMGKISYGLYVFHRPALYFMSMEARVLPTAILKLLALAITVLLAALSYRFLELPFLRLKERFEIVRSRPVNGPQLADSADSKARTKSIGLGA